MNKIRQLRIAKKIKVNDLAKMLGVSRVSVFNWEKGISIPSQDHLNELCNIFKCSKMDVIDIGEALKIKPKNANEALRFSQEICGAFYENEQK